VKKGLYSEVTKTNYLSCLESYAILLEKKTLSQLKGRYITNTYDARKDILVAKWR
jgi:hypothetical protein